jgi:hypothetical protein
MSAFSAALESLQVKSLRTSCVSFWMMVRSLPFLTTVTFPCSYVRLDIRGKSDAARGFIACAMAVASLAALSDSSSPQRALMLRGAWLAQGASH